MPNGFINCQFDDESEQIEPISFKEGLISCFGNLVRYNLGSRRENVEATTAISMGVLARSVNQDEIDAYADIV